MSKTVRPSTALPGGNCHARRGKFALPFARTRAARPSYCAFIPPSEIPTPYPAPVCGGKHPLMIYTPSNHGKIAFRSSWIQNRNGFAAELGTVNRCSNAKRPPASSHRRICQATHTPGDFRRVGGPPRKLRRGPCFDRRERPSDIELRRWGRI